MAQAKQVLDVHVSNCLLYTSYMLKICSTVVAYYDGKLQGGTYYTFKKARENRLRLINLYSS